MTREPFRRLALMAASALVCGLIAAAWVYLHWTVAAAAIGGGTLVALALTVEPSPRDRKTPREEVRDQVVGLSHREIARKARAASGDDGA